MTAPSSGHKPRVRPRLARILIWCLLLAFLAYFARKLTAMDIAEVGRLIAGCNLWWVASYFVVFNLASLAYARRIGVLMNGYRPLPFTAYFHMDNLACSLGYAVPGLGEVFRLLYLKKKFTVPYFVTVTVVILERLFFLGTGILFLPFLPMDFSGTVQLELLLWSLALVAVLLVALKLRRECFQRLLTSLLSRLRLLQFIGLAGMDHLGDVVGHVLRPLPFLESVALTGGQAALVGLRPYVLFLALGYTMEPISCIAAYVGVYLVMIVPSTPGRVGVFEAACLSLYNGLLGVPISVVLAFLVLERILGIIAMVIQSMYSLWCLNLSFAELVRMNRGQKLLHTKD